MTDKAQNLIDKAAEYREVWRVVFPPEVPAPSDRQFAVWLYNYGEKLVERAIQRTAAKFAAGGLDETHAHRYCTGVLNNLNERQGAIERQQGSGITQR